MFWTRCTLAALVVAVSSGCAGNEGPEVGNRYSDSIRILVENDTGSSLRVFAMVNGLETLLGRVGALEDETVRIPRSMGSVIRLVVRASALNDPGRRHVSEPVTLSQGQRVTWNLRAGPGGSGVPSMSTIRVFACSAPSSC